MKEKRITIQFRLEGLVPSKKNTQQIVQNKTTKKRYIVPSYSYTNWNRKALKSLTEQAANVALKRGIKFPIGPASLSIKFYFKDVIRRDLTNKAESINDTLADAKIILDDSWLHVNPVLIQAELSPKKKHICDIYLSFHN
jgi:Holliday junction resolvase RusA-like endonuclease